MPSWVSVGKAATDLVKRGPFELCTLKREYLVEVHRVPVAILQVKGIT